jgi:hypothetical protein
MISVELLLEVMAHRLNDGEEMTLKSAHLRQLLDYIHKLEAHNPHWIITATPSPTSATAGPTTTAPYSWKYSLE